MKKTYPDLPGWEFELDEVSANVYEVIGADKLGHEISFKGMDLDELIEKCRKDARAIIKRSKIKSRG